MRRCHWSALEPLLRSQARQQITGRGGRNQGAVLRMVRGLSCFDAHGFKRIDVSHSLSRRFFSDKLLGHSPMAPSSQDPTTTQHSKVPTAQDVTTAGGVWAPTSAKRDKLRELRAALEEGQESLDDAATPEQKLDLWLADGLLAIARAADHGANFSLDEVDEWLTASESELPTNLDRAQWESHLEKASYQFAMMASALPSDRFLRDVRDFYECDQDVPELKNTSLADEAFLACVTRHRLGLVKEAANELYKSWDELTSVTDADVDRAAVKGISLETKGETLPLAKAHAVLRRFATGSCIDRVGALWTMLDRDEDGLLDEEQMNRVASLSISPVQSSLNTLFEDALNAYPVRAPLPDLNDEQLLPPQPKGWRERRRQKKVQKRLLKLFHGATKNHFQDEVEMPHRLRCIYAWANKAHQDNKIDSVLVDSHGSSSVLGAGRKRYVELQPKISLPEFLEVQKEHFAHLDRVGTEIVSSFREDLLVDQGKGRENQQLRKDCLTFLGAVSIIDAVIIWL